MKDTKTIETLLEVADFINQVEGYKKKNLASVKEYSRIGFYEVTRSLDKRIPVYERALIMAEKKYNKLLKQLNDEC